MEEKHYQQKSKMWITFLPVILNRLNAFIAMTYVFRLPSDPQHALFFGLSKGRLFVVGAIFLIFISIIVLFSNREKFFRNYCASINNHSQPKNKVHQMDRHTHCSVAFGLLSGFPTETPR